MPRAGSRATRWRIESAGARCSGGVSDRRKDVACCVSVSERTSEALREHLSAQERAGGFRGAGARSTPGARGGVRGEKCVGLRREMHKQPLRSRQMFRSLPAISMARAMSRTEPLFVPAPRNPVAAPSTRSRTNLRVRAFCRACPPFPVQFRTPTSIADALPSDRTSAFGSVGSLERARARRPPTRAPERARARAEPATRGRKDAVGGESGSGGARTERGSRRRARGGGERGTADENRGESRGTAAAKRANPEGRRKGARRVLLPATRCGFGVAKSCTRARSLLRRALFRSS